jgi:hypothetical protein
MASGILVQVPLVLLGDLAFNWYIARLCLL